MHLPESLFCLFKRRPTSRAGNRAWQFLQAGFFRHNGSPKVPTAPGWPVCTGPARPFNVRSNLPALASGAAAGKQADNASEPGCGPMARCVTRAAGGPWLEIAGRSKSLYGVEGSVSTASLAATQPLSRDQQLFLQPTRQTFSTGPATTPLWAPRLSRTAASRQSRTFVRILHT